jgi:hypothetical protein
MIKRTFFAFFVFTCLTIDLFGQSKSDSLSGVWQDMPYIASGWSNTYQFFSDGTFRFNYNQMDCSKRLISKSGDWTILDTVNLRLSIDNYKIIKGGKLIDSDGSCATEKMIEGGEIQDSIPANATIEEHTISNIFSIGLLDFNGDTINMQALGIDSVLFFQINNDPSFY